MSASYVGEIRLFGGDYAPVGWALCDGRLLRIDDYDRLFDLIGTRYGGDGATNFALPDLRGRVPVHQGTGPGLSPRTVSESGGSEQVTLTSKQLPSHQHAFMASTAAATERQPSNTRVLARVSPAADASQRVLYLPNTVTPRSDFELDTLVLTPVGGNQAHGNLMPSLAVNFIICLHGEYPSQY